ncbi:MAG TPA: hypothetical protein VGP72_33280 [Planctomycetota bacterium]
MATAIKPDKQELTIHLRQVDGWYAATVDEVPEIQTQGRTIEEALDMVRDAFNELQAAEEEEDS